MSNRVFLASSILTAALALPASAHFIGVVGNNSIDGSLCVGFDCVAEEAFGFDTIRMKENNLRLHFDDTSVAAAFPPNDWRLYANDSANGGASYFGVEDATAGRFVFRVFAGARANALTVDSQGDLGLGTTTPATDIDIKIGDTPTVRLQQDGTSGFTPQTWDMAGNEVNWFVRDATSGSTLPLRIRVGAPTSAIDIASDGDVGIGTSSPDDALEIERSGATAVALRLTNGTGSWRFNHNGNTGRMNIVRDGAATPVKISTIAQNNLLAVGINAAGTDTANVVSIDGDLVISGNCTEVDGACADYVFADDYELMPLYEVETFITENSHLPNVPSAAEMERNGVNMAFMSGRLLEKIEELTLHTIAQQKMIDELRAELAAR